MESEWPEITGRDLSMIVSTARSLLRPAARCHLQVCRAHFRNMQHGVDSEAHQGAEPRGARPSNLGPQTDRVGVGELGTVAVASKHGEDRR